jgi:phosphatidyl-myo-inositol dimannoside synthase
MKILIVTQQFPPQVGGIATYTYNIAKNWPDAEKNVVVLTKSKQSKKESSFKILNSGFNSFKIMIDIWFATRKNKIDLVHLHCAYKYPSCIGWFFRKIIKKPYRLFLHSIDFNYIKKNKHRKNKIKRICNSAHEIIVNSEYLKHQFDKNFEESNRQLKIVYPCPTDYFFDEPQVEKIEELKKKLALEGKKVVLTIARMDEGKGFSRLISILSKVLKQSPNLVWIIIGDGSKKKLFIDLIKKNNLQNIIRYIGSIPNEDLIKYYHLADLFVLLTHPDPEAEEDWATVFMEASASGLPILAGRVGGVDEAIKDLQTGVIVDVNQEEQVAKNMIELLKNKEYSKKLGQQGKQWVKENFDWSREIQKLSS